MTFGSGGQRSNYDIIGEFNKWGPFGDRSRAIARRIILSIANGVDPKTDDVLPLVKAALNSPFAAAAQAVIEAEPRYVRARLIELAAMVAAGDEAEAVAK